jgi:hypothetical protein
MFAPWAQSCAVLFFVISISLHLQPKISAVRRKQKCGRVASKHEQKKLSGAF